MQVTKGYQRAQQAHVEQGIFAAILSLNRPAAAAECCSKSYALLLADAGLVMAW